MAYSIYCQLKQQALEHIDNDSSKFPVLHGIFYEDYERKVDDNGYIFGYIKPRENKNYEKLFLQELCQFAEMGYLVCVTHDYFGVDSLRDKCRHHDASALFDYVQHDVF